MLKSTIMLNENIDIGQYKKVIAFLKRKNDNYQPKKSNTLTAENVKNFLENAPDDIFLLLKVLLIVGLNGACRCAELCNITMDDITDTGNIAIINLPDTKTKRKRIFTVTNDCKGYDLFKKYLLLRPPHVKHTRFFLYYKLGKCTIQPVGMHTIALVSQKIAEFLQLPDFRTYTGHCLDVLPLLF